MPFKERKALVKSRCGGRLYFDRDCLPADAVGPLWGSICSSHAYVAKHPARYVEFWSEDGSAHLFTMHHRSDSLARALACNERYRAYAPSIFQVGSADDPFTIDIPGVGDILRTPWTTSPSLRRQRIERMRTAKSVLPSGLAWVPKLINKLDDAQDLLFTGLALAWPLLRVVAPRLLGPLGVVLTINDVLNVGT